MIINAFDVLGIEPTTDFKTVKKAYIRKAMELHPDLYLDQQVKQEKTEQFAKLASAWELIDSQEKLQYHFNKLNSGVSANAFIPEEESTSNSSDRTFSTECSDSLSIPKTGFINIFIPVNVFDAQQEKDFPHHREFPLRKLDHNFNAQQFQNAFNYQKLAEVLSNISKDSQIQVGVTREEAKEIVNQHGHRSYTVLVEVSISLSRLSEHRISEQELYGGGVLNAGSVKCFLLHKNTKINENDILSAAPMVGNDYQNSLKFPKILGTRRTNIQKLWPENLVVRNLQGSTPSLVNENMQAENAIEYSEVESIPAENPKVYEMLEKLQKLTENYLQNANNNVRPIVEVLAKILKNDKKNAQERIVNFYEQLDSLERDSKTNLQHIKEDQSYSAKQFVFGLMIITATLVTGILPGLIVIGIVKALSGKSPLSFFTPSKQGDDYARAVEECKSTDPFNLK